MPAPAPPPLKNPARFTLVGKPTPRLDTRVKVDGSAVFGIDVTIPGMLTVVVARPPVFGGALRSFDAVKAKAVPGVREVVEAAGKVAVAADTFWSAKKGRDALEVVWDEGPLAGLSTEAYAPTSTQNWPNHPGPSPGRTATPSRHWPMPPNN